MSSSEEEAAREKYRVENQQNVQGQAVGDLATVHIYNAPVSYTTPSTPAPSTPATSPIAKMVWNVPFPRNALFTGRSELLDLLARTLQTGQPAALSQPPKDVQPQAISGLGGIGKTQVALEYAYRYRSDYQAVLWTQAETKDTLTTSYLEIARLLNLPENDAQESAQVIGAVKEWLRTSTKYLLILDNADDLKLASEFVPPTFGGHILLTTRAQAMGRFAQRLEVETLPIEQGMLFLLRRAGVLAIEASLDQAGGENQWVARELCEELGGLPLALDQAGAYIEETGCGLANYVKRYEQQRATLLTQRRGLVNDHPLPVATTWTLSFEQVKQKSAVAADLLQVCAFLAPDAIPELIFTKGAPYFGPQLVALEMDDFVLDEAIEVLLAYSLIRRNETTQTLSVHRLVQAVIKDGMEEEMQRKVVERVVQAVDAAFPTDEHEIWGTCEQLLPHALRCALLIERYELREVFAARLLNQASVFLRERARYAEAEKLVTRALTIYEEQLGNMHPWTAVAMSNLAASYQQRGMYEDAVLLLEFVLFIDEAVYGPDEPEVATALNNLGLLYKEQGKYREAEPLYERSLQIRKRQLGEQHLAVAIALNNLAELYREQGKYGEAEPLYKRALAIDEATYGQRHPSVATDLNNLASLYYRQRKYGEAELLYERALAIREEFLGEHHPDMAISLNNLGLVYKEQGKYEKAEQLYERALIIHEAIYGAFHSSIAMIMNNMGALYRAQERYREAELSYTRAVQIREQRLGKWHLETGISVRNLAGVYEQQRKYGEAELSYKRALAILERELGEGHSSVTGNLNNLALLYESQGKYSEAELLYQRAVALLKQSLGSEHPNTQVVRGNYAGLLRQLGREQEAEELEARNQQQE